jgi:hypothetical protein
MIKNEAKTSKLSKQYSILEFLKKTLRMKYTEEKAAIEHCNRLERQVEVDYKQME